jgi:type II secretory pathway pseudopilin PulG
MIIQRGQTLIETLAALGILSIVITGISISVTTSLSNAKYNQNVTLATKYAQQGAELVQQIRDDSYTNFKNYNGTYCLAKGQTSLGSTSPSCTVTNVDNFVRSVVVQQAPGCGANVAEVVVSVAFNDGKCATGVFCHKQTVSTCLSTVEPVQVP